MIDYIHFHWQKDGVDSEASCACILPKVLTAHCAVVWWLQVDYWACIFPILAAGWEWAD